MAHALVRLNEEQVFLEADVPLLVVDGELVIRAANPSYLRAVGRCREELLGTSLFEAFPDNPDDPQATGVTNLSASLETVFRTGQLDRMALQRYDIRGPRQGDGFVRRFWTVVNSPLRDGGRRVIGALLHAEDVTATYDPVFDESRVLDGPDAQAWNELVGTLVRETAAHLRSRAEVAQLEEALSSRIVIEQAKGVVMATCEVDADEAFEVLRKWARHSRTPLHDVCAEVVATRRVPPRVEGGRSGGSGRDRSR